MVKKNNLPFPSYHKVSFNLGKDTWEISSGKIAKQSNSVIIKVRDTVIMVNTVIGNEEVNSDFLPLSIDYFEKFYASGKIPGNYFRRETRQTENEILISRLIDRSLRPILSLENNNIQREIQIVATVLSLDSSINPDVVSIIASSASLAISNILSSEDSFISAFRVGYIKNEYVLNPSLEDLKKSKLNLVVSNKDKKILMVEGESKELSEKEILEAVKFGQEKTKIISESIKDLFTKFKNIKRNNFSDSKKIENSKKINLLIKENYLSNIKKIFNIHDKLSRNNEFNILRKKIIEDLISKNDFLEEEIKKSIYKIEKECFKNKILKYKERIDGRDFDSLRPISIENNLLPRSHGSSLFTRGQTQALVTTTLGSDKDVKFIEDVNGVRKDNLMVHYNFPSYCVGEIGKYSYTKRREIGHGFLVRKSIESMLPKNEKFPYVLRLVSDILESDGSSSMASVCGASLSLMESGVPIKEHVAGISIGLVSSLNSENDYILLTDIIGDEDCFGDMDFKISGTKNGITAIQMDVKIPGINLNIFEESLEKGLKARIKILEIMNNSINFPRKNISKYAPQISIFKVNKSKIKNIIGKGGVTIRSITEKTNSVIDISDNGNVKIFCNNSKNLKIAKNKIMELCKNFEIGKHYKGKVSKITSFGAFINIAPNKDGLLHISQITKRRLESVEEVLKEGQMVNVKIKDIDRNGRIKLTMLF